MPTSQSAENIRCLGSEKYADYQQMTRTQTVDNLLQGQVLRELSVALLKAYLDRSRSVRLLGLTV